MWPSWSGRSATIPLAYAARRRRAGPAVHDRVRPLAVEVDVVARRVQVPGPARPAAGSRSRRTSAPSGRRTTPCASPTSRSRARRSPAGPSRAARRTPARCRSGWWRRTAARSTGSASPRARSGSSARRSRARPAPSTVMRVVEALVALDELLDRDRVDALPAEHAAGRGRARPASSTRTVSDAPAPLRGLRISGKPTCVGERARLGGAADRGRGGGRHPRLAQRLLHRRLVPAQPGRPHRGARDACTPRGPARRPVMCASIVASSRSTHSLSCTQRTARVIASTSVTDGTCS